MTDSRRNGTTASTSSIGFEVGDQLVVDRAAVALDRCSRHSTGR